MNRIKTPLTRTENELTHSLIEAAALSAMLRLQRRTNLAEGTGSDRKNENLRRATALRFAMTKLGHRCRRLHVDVREGPFWTLLEHQECYEAAYGNHRSTVLEARTCTHWKRWLLGAGARSFNDGMTWLEALDDARTKRMGKARDESSVRDAFMKERSVRNIARRPGVDTWTWYVSGEGSGLWPFDPEMMPARVREGRRTAGWAPVAPIPDARCATEPELEGC
jgi:hypothetical protein